MLTMFSPLYRAGGETNRDHVEEFVESETRMPNGGFQFEDVFGFDLFEKMKVDTGTPLYYRAINRMSKGMTI
jgi:hypothetical protein